MLFIAQVPDYRTYCQDFSLSSLSPGLCTWVSTGVSEKNPELANSLLASFPLVMGRRCRTSSHLPPKTTTTASPQKYPPKICSFTPKLSCQWWEKSHPDNKNKQTCHFWVQKQVLKLNCPWVQTVNLIVKCFPEPICYKYSITTMQYFAIIALRVSHIFILIIIRTKQYITY